MASQFVFANFFGSELLTQLSVADTTLILPPSDSAALPTFNAGQNFILAIALWDGDNPPEIVYCMANDGAGSLTVSRGMEGTSAFAWAPGTQVVTSITAGMLAAAFAAYNSGQILIGNYLPLSGGTLTGFLTLPANPTVPLHAVTKAYVDALGTGPFLPLSGGTMANATSNINMNTARIINLPPPVGTSDAATKAYADAIIAKIVDASGQLVSGGSDTAYTLTTTTNYAASVPDGTFVKFRAHITSKVSPAPTLSVDADLASPLRWQSGIALPPQAIAVDSIIGATFRAAGPEWIIDDIWTPPVGGIATTGGPLNYSAVSNLGLVVLQDGYEVELFINASNTGACNLNLDSLGNQPLRPTSGIDFTAGQMPQYSKIRVRWNATTGEWLVCGLPGNVSPIVTSNLGFAGPINMQIQASVLANALTVSLKTSSGVDATVSNPIQIPFPDSNTAAGDPVWRNVSTALSLSTQVGATFGVPNGQPFRLWLVAIDNLGTVSLALWQALSTQTIFPLNEIGLQTTVAMSGASNQAGVYYANSAIASKSIRILGYLEWSSGLAVSGTFNNPPTSVRLFGPGVKKPGDVVQSIRSSSGAFASGNTAIPLDNTIPQSSEGDQYFAVTITPVSPANVMLVETQLVCNTSPATNRAVVALFQDSIANALSAALQINQTAQGAQIIRCSKEQVAGTSAAIQFKTRGAGHAGNFQLNVDGGATGGNPTFGGVLDSYLKVQEISV